MECSKAPVVTRCPQSTPPAMPRRRELPVPTSRASVSLITATESAKRQSSEGGRCRSPPSRSAYCALTLLPTKAAHSFPCGVSCPFGAPKLVLRAWVVYAASCGLMKDLMECRETASTATRTGGASPAAWVEATSSAKNASSDRSIVGARARCRRSCPCSPNRCWCPCATPAARGI